MPAEAGPAATAPRPQPVSKAGPDAETVRAMVEVAAFYRAEKRGFAAGGAVRDRLEAEAEIAARLGRPR